MLTDRSTILEKMRARSMSIDQFNYEKLSAPPLLSFLNMNDINELKQIGSSLRLSGRPEEKLRRIDEVMRTRNFRKLAGGTNRVVYKHLEYDPIIVKIAHDDVGRGDTPREYFNQAYLKPFVTKVFEYSPCGTVGLFERCIPVTSRQEFLSVAEDYFDLLKFWFTGEYIMEDIGSNYFMNVGVRNGFGPVLLDFPYLYKLDGNKLYCNKPDDKEPSGVCGGIIDYDDGYNHLYCSKCGKRYRAKELEAGIENGEVVIERSERSSHMKVRLQRGDVGVVRETGNRPSNGVPYIKPHKSTGRKSKVGSLSVSLKRGKEKITTVKPFQMEDSEESKKSGVKVRLTRAAEAPVQHINDDTIVRVTDKTVDENSTKTTPVVEATTTPSITEPVKEEVKENDTTVEQETITETTTVVEEQTVENDDSDEDYTDQEMNNIGFIPCAGVISNTQTISIFGENDALANRKCIVLASQDDESVMLTDQFERPYCIMTIDGYDMSDIVVLTAEARDEMRKKMESLVDANAEQSNRINELIEVNRELEHELAKIKAEENKQPTKTNSSSKKKSKSSGAKRDPETGRFVSSKDKEKQEKEPDFDTSSSFIPNPPVGSVPPDGE